MRKDRLIRDYFGTQVFITTSGNFSTTALLCAAAEVGVDAIMFAIDYPFESVPNGCVWFDEHVPLSERDKVRLGRNNCLQVLPRLQGEPHCLQLETPSGCGLGGLKEIQGEVEYGLYNKDWSRRLVKQ